MLERLIPFQEIDVITNAKVDSYRNGILKMVKNGEVKEIECDNVILAVGYKEKADLYHELEFEVPEIYLLGDARRVSNIMYGIWDAFEVASHI
jgi:2-enoate reductase